MLSILVCHSYYLRRDQKQVLRAKPYPPLATLQVVSLLRKAGHRVAFFDAMLADGREEYDRLLQADRPQVVLFYEDNFNFLSKMCLDTMRRAACDMIASARNAGARVISAGPDVTDAPGPYLNAGADLASLGGAEALAGGVSKASALIPDVGLAAWDLVDMDGYRAVWLKAHGYFSLNMAASRGWPFRCTWCAKPIWGNQYLQRNATEVALEIGFLKRSFKPDHIWFADDIFGFRVDWVAEFAASVRAADAGIPFSIQTRADLVSERMAEALREAGCREAWIGAESGSQRVLDAMNKGTTVAEVQIARDRLKAAGIRVGFFIQLGYMGEELDDILATRALLEAARPDEIGVSVSYPLPGTKFYDLVKAPLGGKTHWRESDDLDMMFHGTYTSDFYRSVRNLMHDQVALQSGAAPPASDEHRRVQHALDRRWQDLLSQELNYRSRPARAALAG